MQTYSRGAEFLQRVKGLYRADLWGQTPYHVEVWVESRSLAGVVQNDCRELAVSLYPAGGFSSATLPYEAAEEINAQVMETYSYGEHSIEALRGAVPGLVGIGGGVISGLT